MRMEIKELDFDLRRYDDGKAISLRRWWTGFSLPP